MLCTLIRRKFGRIYTKFREVQCCCVCLCLLSVGRYVIKAQNYVKAKIRSRVFNIGAVAIAGFGILMVVQIYFKNMDQDSFWRELAHPVAIGLVLFPFLVALLFMYLSRRADKQMETILRQHEADLRKANSKGKA